VILLSLPLAAMVHGDRVAAQVGPLPGVPGLPEVQVPDVPGVPDVQVPDVQVPDLPPPPIPTPPRLPTPPAPNLPDLPAVDRVLPQVPSTTSGPGLPQTPGLPGGGSAPSGSSGTASSGQGAAGATAAGPGAAAGPAAAGGGSAARRTRNAAVRRRGPGWTQPLDGRPLRRLRRTLDEAEDCLGLLSPRGRRALGLLAGGQGRGPASRQVAARRLGISGPALIRLERRSLRTLRRAGGSAGCGAPAAVGTGVFAAARESEPLTWAGGDGERSAGRSPGSDASRSGEERDSTRSGVLGTVESGDPQPSLNVFDEGSEGNPDALLFALMVLLILALGVGLALRSGVAPVAPAARRPNGERPLLLLEVDGVLFLSPLAASPPPGRVHFLEGGELWVPDRVTELLRRLETRFDLVWATAEGHFANRDLRRLFGLQGKVPVMELEGRGRVPAADRKIRTVQSHSAERPIAWVADAFSPAAHRWANRRRPSTLLLEVERGAGLSQDHAATLMEWADALEAGAERAAAREPAS
jgi:hypothetical protein